MVGGFEEGRGGGGRVEKEGGGLGCMVLWVDCVVGLRLLVIQHARLMIIVWLWLIGYLFVCLFACLLSIHVKVTRCWVNGHDFLLSAVWGCSSS